MYINLFLLQHDLWPNLPYVLFGGIALLAGLAGEKLPETKGKTLPDSIDRKIIVISTQSYVAILILFIHTQ